MKVLITGFDPFGGEAVNPAWNAVSKLPSSIKDIEIVKEQIPTVFKKSISELILHAKKHKPDIIICVGQAGGRFEISLERIAINIDDARIKDNEGNQPIDETIYSDGEVAYFSTLPVKTIVDELKKIYIPTAISNTAGTFVCNHIMYGLMYNIKKQNIAKFGGFVHVPYLPEQIISKPNTPYMEECRIIDGLKKIIEVSGTTTIDKKITGGREY